MNGSVIFNLDEPLVIPPNPIGLADEGSGTWTFLYDGKLLDEVKKYYRRENENVKIKIIKIPIKDGEKLEDHLWCEHTGKNSPIHEALVIQNIFALYDFAPRAYGLFEIHANGNRYAAFLTDYLGPMGNYPHDNSGLINKIKVMSQEKGINYYDDGRGTNVIADKYIDFQGFRMGDDFINLLKKRVTGIANIGKWGPWQNYQTVEQLGLTGGRDMQHRITNLGLDQIDFTGKTVLDIGCSEGEFCRYVSDHGARKVVGVDLPGVALAAGELSYYLGYFNIDYVGANLKKESIESLGKFDYVLFLSMCHHVGYLPYLSKLTNEILIFEGNAKNDDIEVQTKLNQDFSRVEPKGTTSDLFNRPVIWAYS